jgi:circadian clock protein KaiC
LVAAEERKGFRGDNFKSGVDQLDSLIGGGLARGSSTLVLGPAGVGKSLLVLQFIAAAVKRGESAAMFVFDEEIGLLIARAKALGIDLQAMCDAKQLFIEQMDAAELSPGEFSHRVRARVEEEGSQVVVIDSLSGYEASMPGNSSSSCTSTS